VETPNACPPGLETVGLRGIGEPGCTVSLPPWSKPLSWVTAGPLQVPRGLNLTWLAWWPVWLGTAVGLCFPAVSPQPALRSVKG
jgi:hypothetical protein